MKKNLYNMTVIEYLEECHRKWMKKGMLEFPGFLTIIHYNSFSPYSKLLAIFYPSYKEKEELSKEGKSIAYWESGCLEVDSKKYSHYTPMRQNIILLLIEMMKDEEYIEKHKIY